MSLLRSRLGNEFRSCHIVGCDDFKVMLIPPIVVCLLIIERTDRIRSMESSSSSNTNQCTALSVIYSAPLLREFTSDNKVVYIGEKAYHFVQAWDANGVSAVLWDSVCICILCFR
ncbi:hypothetical protein AB6A40_009060 [Gnathostoma spinigerum]|uniref:Uncharacterized protein n=1 Tax=Gnathostoma spinigerum TaxID=75299 RepID=A0ABD6ESQ4_9BILA